MALTLSILNDRLAVCQLSPGSAIPDWAIAQPFFSITATPEELSIVCLEKQVPATVKCERGWRALKLEGPFDFALTGILAPLAVALADVGISIFAIATYDTDYILVQAVQLEAASQVLIAQGYIVQA